MDTARVQKTAEPAPAAQAKKAPFFPAAAVQPKVKATKPGHGDAPAHASANMPIIRPMPVMRSPQPQAPKQEGSFFKPAAAPAPTAIVRNLYGPKTDLQATPAIAPKAEQATPANKQEGAAKTVPAIAPAISIPEKTGTKTDLAPGAQPAAAIVSQPEAAHADPAAKTTSDLAAHSAPAAPSAAEAPQAKEAVQPDNPKSVTAPPVDLLQAPAAPAAGKAGTKAGEAAAPVDPDSPYKHLNPAKTEGVFKAKLYKAGTLAHKTAATKPAAQKIEESKAAQDTPVEENQAKSNDGQVSDFNNKPQDPKTDAEAKNALDTAITANMPTTLKAVDEFKDSGKGHEISKTVMTQVNSDVADVKSGYQGIAKMPEAAPAEKGTPLPPAEPAEQVAPINMGAGVVPTIDKPELETKQYTGEVDNKLKDEGLTQEHLDLVDSGDLANANKERKKLQKDVVSQPAEVQHMASHEHTKVAAEMQAHETNSRAEMHGHRDQHLSKTAEKQQKAKEELERKRAEVAKNINDRYKACQTSIMSKLDNLEKSSLAQFDAGQAKATHEFEDQVKRDIDKFKDKRYDRIGGSLLWLKDKLFGIDDFPEVVQAFDDARKTFAGKIDTLIGTITKANNEVIAGCKKELEDTKSGIKKYVDSLGPQLQDAAKKAEEDVNKQLQQLSAEIDKRKEKLQQALADKRKAAMAAIDKKIEAMKEKLKGAVSVIGNLLLQAALKFFKWALESVGLSPDSIMGVINKGVSIIKAIVAKPMVFVGNLIKAAKLGLWNFAKNFLTHLKDALFNWLTGALEGVTLPKVWDMKGIFFLALDIIGLSYPAIRRKMVNLMGETAVAVLEKTFTLVKTLVTEGPAAAWDQLKEMADEIKTTFIDAVKEWVRNTIIFKAIETIVEIFVPGAGIVKAIVGIYDTIMFFIQKAKQIIQMVGSFLDSVGDIVAGRIDGAAGALEAGLATGLTLVINFLAKFLHLDGITDKIKKAIETIRGKVDKMLDKVVLWIKNTAGKLVGKKDDKDKKDEHDPEKQKKIDAATVELRAEEQKYLVSDKLKLEDAKKVAATIKSRHSVFSSFEVVDDGEDWDYDYTASPGKKLPGHKKAEGKDAVLKSSEPKYGKTNAAGFGTEVTAEVLTKEPSAGGSEADAGWTTDVYTILNKRRKTSGSTYPYYKRGHLLSWRFGGPGDAGKNLTPLSSSGNGLHRNMVEARLQAALQQKNSKGRYAAFSYRITPIYRRSDVISIDAFGFKATDKRKKKTIEQILNAEKKYVPAQLICEVTEIKKDKEPLITNLGGTITVENTIDSDVQNYYVQKQDMVDDD